MNKHTRAGLEIIQVALILGLLGNVLLRATPWGINATLFNVAFVVGMYMLLRRHAPDFLTRQTFSLFGALVFFASMFAWRDSIELKTIDTFAIIAILSILFLPRMGIAARVAGVFQYGVAFLFSAFSSFFAPFFLLFNDIEWAKLPQNGFTRHLFSVLRGIAIVTPILLIFGALFVAADAVYAGWVQRVFNIEPNVIISHVALTAFFAWLTAGFLRSVLIRDSDLWGAKTTSSVPVVEPIPAAQSESSPYLPNNLSILEHINISDPPNEAAAKQVPVEPAKKPGKKKSWDWAKFDNSFLPVGFTLGTVEVSIVMGLMNLLFLSFVIVQIPYLFGGMDLVQNTPDFKLAEYARRGFGELVAVAALVLPILLVGQWLIRKDAKPAQIVFRILAGIQIALLFVIMASAVQRLVLLTGNLGYGMTTVRLYPLIFMSWLAIVFIWFSATVLRGYRQHFAWGALWSALFVIGAAHVLNPDDFIARTNIALMREGREFDARYNADLGGDATPALIEALPDLRFEDQCTVKRKLREHLSAIGEESDLRSWNWSRSRHHQLLVQAGDSIAVNAECPKPVYFSHQD